MAGRSSFRDPARLFAAISEPVYFVDAQGRMAFLNPACAALAGLDPRELVGLECRFHSDPSVAGPEAQAALLAPPPEAFSGAVRAGELSWPSATGVVRRFRAEYTRLVLAAGQPAGVLVVLRALAEGETAADAGADETRAAALHDRLRRHRGALARQYDADRLLGDHPAMEQVRQQALLASRSEANVSIVGPVGSGRRHLARAIHYHRGGQLAATIPAGTLAPMDCGGLPAELLSSTLRTLTMGEARRTAAPATLLLSDVERLEPEAQAELAAILARKTPLRVLSTSQVALAELARDNRFRSDLACQLSTLVVVLPALTERRGDIPLLAQMFLEEINAQGAKQLSGFTPEALDQLASYSWPGNVGELAEIVRQAHAAAAGPQIRPTELPQRIHLAREAALYPAKRDETIALDEFLASIERDVITQALARARGRKAKAARLLGLSRNKLLRRMAQLGLEVESDEPETSAETSEVEFEPDDGSG